MHPSSLENMQKCYDRYVVPLGFTQRSNVAVLDLGGANVNGGRSNDPNKIEGSYRSIFADSCFDYQVADLATCLSGTAEYLPPEYEVDIVLTDPYHIPLADNSVDIVLSGQMLEHCEFFWLVFQEMLRVLAPDGLLLLIAPSAGPIHRYPVDCYRFYPDAYVALAKYGNCQLHAMWHDERGPWRDLVGVFGKTSLELTELPEHVYGPQVPFQTAPNIYMCSRSSISATIPNKFANMRGVGVSTTSPEEVELIAGQVPYLTVLQQLHKYLKPRLYLEIGVRHGRSFNLATCQAIGIDNDPELEQPLPNTHKLFVTTSDDFFEMQAHQVLTTALDMVFIDGMHLFEYALRDFMHVERYASANTVVIIDDIYPNHWQQASRTRTTRVWTGDVWKLQYCLAEQRPDLLLLPLNTSPTGLLLVTGLNPDNRKWGDWGGTPQNSLWERYNPLVRQYRELSPIPPATVLQRQGAITPDESTIANWCERWKV